MHAISSYRGKKTHKQTYKQGRLQYIATLGLARSAISYNNES